MSHISVGVEYALHCLLYLTGPPNGVAVASVRDLADLQGLPIDFVAKLFTKLRKAGLTTSTEGKGGGFRLAKSPSSISVLDVVSAIDGDKPLFDCREIRAQCAIFDGRPPSWATDSVCSIHAVMLDAEKRMREALASQTLAKLAARTEAKVPRAFGASVVHWIASRKI